MHHSCLKVSNIGYLSLKSETNSENLNMLGEYTYERMYIFIDISPIDSGIIEEIPGHSRVISASSQTLQFRQLIPLIPREEGCFIFSIKVGFKGWNASSTEHLLNKLNYDNSINIVF